MRALRKNGQSLGKVYIEIFLPTPTGQRYFNRILLILLFKSATAGCVSENAHKALDQTEYQKRYDGLVKRFDRTKERLEAVSHAIVEKQAQREKVEMFLAELEKQDGLCTEFDESLWISLVDYVTVYNKDDVRFTFKDGTEIRA